MAGAQANGHHVSDLELSVRAWVENIDAET